MLPASLAAMAFVLVSAWLWAERGPGTPPLSHNADAYRHAAMAAAALALALAVTAALGNHRRLATVILLVAALALAIARAPIPEQKLAPAEKIVELEGRILRFSASQYGGYWGLIDQVQDLEQNELLAPSQSILFTAPISGKAASGDWVRLRGVLSVKQNRLDLRRCQMRKLNRHQALSWLEQGRAWVRNRIQLNLPPPHQAMAIALLLGEKAGLNFEQKQSYRRLGLLHLLAISGMHFWVWSALLRRLLPPSLSALRLPLLLVLAALANFGAPVVRAFTAVLLRDWMASRGRGIAPFTLWSTAVWVELALAPGLDVSLGFLLTYLATAALLWGRPPRHAPTWRKVLQPSTTAFLGTMPSLHALQGTIEPWSIPLTPVFALAIPPRLIASLAAVCHGLSGLSQNVFSAIHWLEEWLFTELSTLPAAPWVALHLPVAAFLPLTFIALLAFGPLPLGWSSKRWFLTLPLIGWMLWPRVPNSQLLSLPVGHGLNCALVCEQKTVLFDAGSASQSALQVVDRGLLPSLNRFQAKSQADLVLSHGDDDHINAVSFLNQRLHTQLVDCQIGEWRTLEHTHPFHVRIFACPRAGSQDNNDGGIVMEVSGFGKRTLLIGDSFGYSLRHLATQLSAGPIDLLLLPHHGLTTDGVAELLDHLKPRQTWASSAESAKMLPVAPLLEVRGIPLHSTADGILIFDFKP